MKRFQKTAALALIVMFVASTSAATSLRGPDEVNITKVLEDNSSDENLTTEIVKNTEKGNEEAKSIKHQIKEKLEEKTEEMQDSERSSRLKAHKSGEGFFSVLFSIF